MGIEEKITDSNTIKKDFLQMLQDSEVRAAIFRIVQEGNAAAKPLPRSKAAEAARNPLPYEAENLRASLEKEQEWCDELQDENEALYNQLRQLQQDRDNYIKNIERLQEERQELSRALEVVNEAAASILGDRNVSMPLLQRLEKLKILLREQEAAIERLQESLKEEAGKNTRLQAEKDEQQKAYEAAKIKHAQEKAHLIREMESLQGEKQRLEQRKNAMEKANQALQRQLDERFARGWELFERYQNVSEHTRQLLHNGVFTQESSFMSFICGGAQTASLDKLWEVLRDCIMRGQQNDAEILWDIFEYCLELVNASKTQAKYEILAVEEGDSFDPDCHTEGPDSKAQGTVRAIYLRGYRNTYGDKILKKSIVQVG